MQVNKTRRAFSAALITAPFTGVARAQDFPSKPIRIVVAFAPGGTADISTRIVAERLSVQLGQSVIVDNRPGAGGISGAEQVASAAPDGYTLLMSGNHVAIAQLLSRTARYDPVKSFAQIARCAVVPSGLFVNASSPITSLESMLAYARSHRETVTYASGGTGTPSHLAMELLQKRTGIPIRHIPYKGTAPALPDLVGGRVDMLFTSIAGPLALVKAGRLRLLAISSQARLPSLPAVPTIGETLAGFQFEVWVGLAAPRATPAAIIERLSTEVGLALQDPGVVRRMEDAGLGVSYVASADIGRRVEEETAVLAKVIKDANIASE